MKSMCTSCLQIPEPTHLLICKVPSEAHLGKTCLLKSDLPLRENIYHASFVPDGNSKCLIYLKGEKPQEINKSTEEDGNTEGCKSGIWLLCHHTLSF